MNILVTGANGQLGSALRSYFPKGLNTFFLDKDKFNLTKPDQCMRVIDEIKPNWIINAGAFTNVDKVEENESLALMINSETPFRIAKYLEKYDANFLYISTDYVFNGKKSIPYNVDDEVSPLNVYGKSKAIGEKKCLSLSNTFVLRTSWVYGVKGNNFLNSMFKLFLKQDLNSRPISIVSDQIGCPTNVYKLAKVCWELIINKSALNNRVYHWSDAGEASWFDFANEIHDLLLSRNLIKNKIDLVPISLIDYKRKAVCPKYSLLDSSITKYALKINQEDWKKELKKVIYNFNKY